MAIQILAALPHLLNQESSSTICTLTSPPGDLMHAKIGLVQGSAITTLRPNLVLLPVFVNKILFKYSHTYSFLYRLKLFPSYNRKVEYLK